MHTYPPSVSKVRCQPLLLLLVALALLPGLARAANITLTQALLDDYRVNGILDFSQPTLGYAPNAVSNNLQPGDTIYIQAHTRKLLRLKNITQGTTGNPIVITNTGGQFILSDTTPSHYDSQGLGLWGAQHVIVRGTPSPGNYDYGIKVASTKPGASGVEITHNGLTGASFVGSLDVEITGLEIGHTGFAGIRAACQINAVDLPVGGYIMDNIRIHDNYIHDTGGEALYIGWTSPGHHDMSNVTIHDNLIVNAGWDGIQLNTCVTGGSIYNNIVLGYGVTSYTASSIGHPYGWQNEGLSVGKSSVVIHHNWIQATNQYSGAALSFFTYAPSVVHDNVFILGDLGGSSPEDAIYINQSGSSAPVVGATLAIVNNTIVEPDRNGLDFSSAVTVPVTFINNIVARPVHGTYTTTPANTTLTQSNNLLVSTVAGAGFVDAVNDDYHLASGSAAVDAGANTSSYGVTDDFDATARPQGSAYDIGAYEREQSITLTIITPAATGTATGSSYCAAVGSFTAQPTWDAVNARPTGVDPLPHSTTGTSYANGHWYIDFGVDYAKIRLVSTWTRWRAYSSGNYSGFPALWWDDDKDNVNDGINASPVNFAAAQGLVSSSSQQWAKDAEFLTPITPQGRYLVISAGPSPTNHCNEFAFVGYVVP